MCNLEDVTPVSPPFHATNNALCTTRNMSSGVNGYLLDICLQRLGSRKIMTNIGNRTERTCCGEASTFRQAPSLDMACHQRCDHSVTRSNRTFHLYCRMAGPHSSICIVNYCDP